VFRIESKKDMRLVRRAQREGWDYDRAEVAKALMEIVANRDPDLMLDAIDRLHRGDEISIKLYEADIKRELMELKRAGDDNQIRLRLLELARHVEPSELAKIASENGIIDSAATERSAD
jgi:hypothetical protein